MKGMFSFGTRQINKQGGSYLISLPIQWFRDCNFDLKEVTIEMDADKSLRIAPAHPSKNDAGASQTTTS